MPLLDHYLRAVRLYLPKGPQQDDIVDEIAEHLTAKLEDEAVAPRAPADRGGRGGRADAARQPDGGRRALRRGAARPGFRASADRRRVVSALRARARVPDAVHAGGAAADRPDQQAAHPDAAAAWRSPLVIQFCLTTGIFMHDRPLPAAGRRAPASSRPGGCGTSRRRTCSRFRAGSRPPAWPCSAWRRRGGRRCRMSPSLVIGGAAQLPAS